MTGSWAASISPEDIQQLCRLANDHGAADAIKIEAFTGQIGYRDREQDPLRFIIFAHVFSSPRETGARHASGVVVNLSKREGKGASDWNVNVDSPNSTWLKIDARRNQSQPNKWFGEPFLWDKTISVADAIAIFDLAYQKTFAVDDDWNPIPKDLAMMRIESLGHSPEPKSKEIEMTVGLEAGSSWNFINFKKTRQTWKVARMGYGIADANMRTWRPFNTISPRRLAARSADR